MNVYDFEKYLLGKGYRKYKTKFNGNELVYIETNQIISELSTMSNLDFRYLNGKNEIVIALSFLNRPPIVLSLFYLCSFNKKLLTNNMTIEEIYTKFEGEITCEKAYNAIIDKNIIFVN